MGVGSATVGALSNLTGYSRTKIYALVGKLVSKGWITTISDKPRTYVPLDPSEVLAHKKTSMLASFKTALNELTPEYDRIQSNVSEIVTYRGFEVIKKVREMLKQAQSEVLIITAFLPRDNLDEFLSSFYDLKSKGVKIKILISERLKDLESIKVLRKEIDINFVNVPYAGILSVDGREVLFGSEDGHEAPPSNILGIWTRSKELVDFSRLIFSKFHKPAEDL
jgi:sugar-specific transcriptional regulator TrmB